MGFQKYNLLHTQRPEAPDWAVTLALVMLAQLRVSWHAQELAFQLYPLLHTQKPEAPDWAVTLALATMGQRGVAVLIRQVLLLATHL